MRRLELANFNLNLLVALDGLLSQRSVTAAAKRVRVTPSAMSHSLSELRDLLDDPLLVRAGRGMVLTPRAESLVGPLHTLLVDTERLLQGGATFDPATTARRFVIAAPDFLATLLLPALLEATAREAPGICLEIVPSARRGNAWLLESGDLDLALGAIVDEAPGIRRMDLCTEGFACAVIVRRHAKLGPPLAGQPGPFSLGGAGVLQQAFEQAGFRDVRAETVAAPLRMKTASHCLRFEQESFGALHQMLSSLDPAGRNAAWAEVGAALEEFDKSGEGFVGPCELVVAVGTK